MVVRKDGSRGMKTKDGGTEERKVKKEEKEKVAGRRERMKEARKDGIKLERKEMRADSCKVGKKRSNEGKTEGKEERRSNRREDKQ